MVKAEDLHGRRFHIGKPMLREWRDDFARMMRAQGIAAHATPRIDRGRNKGKACGGMFRAQGRGDSSALRAKVTKIAPQLMKIGCFSEPAARAKLIETRKGVVANWLKVAETLDRQGEIVLAGHVRYFVKQLPPVVTDTERLATKLTRHSETSQEAFRAR